VIIGEPIPVDQTVPDTPASLTTAAADIPEEVRRQVIEMLGSPFVVLLDSVREELKLTDEQSQKLARNLHTTVGDTLQAFQKIGALPPEEREKQLHVHRQKAHAALALALKDTLEASQLRRLRELELQHEGPFAFGRPDVAAELKLADDQRQQFMALVQKMHSEIEPLVKTAQANGNGDVIHLKALKIRSQYADKIEALLTVSQKQTWKALLGDPLDAK
jgi:hypothetical protein